MVCCWCGVDNGVMLLREWEDLVGVTMFDRAGFVDKGALALCFNRFRVFSASAPLFLLLLLFLPLLLLLLLFLVGVFNSFILL